MKNWGGERGSEGGVKEEGESKGEVKERGENVRRHEIFYITVKFFLSLFVKSDDTMGL